MKHCSAVTKSPAVAATILNPLAIKLNGVMEIMDRLLLAQRQAPWKIAFPIGETTTSTTTTNTTPTLPTL